MASLPIFFTKVFKDYATNAQVKEAIVASVAVVASKAEEAKEGSDLEAKIVVHTPSSIVGGETQPVYVDSTGSTVALDYTISKSVPSDAVFTDTHHVSSTIVGASASATVNGAATNNNVYINHIENGSVRASHNIVGTTKAAVTADSNGKITIDAAKATVTNTGSTLAWDSEVVVAKVDDSDVKVKLPETPAPASYIKDASSSGNTLTLTKKDGTTVSFVNSTYTIPTSYVEDVTVSGNTLTLSKKDGTDVSFVNSTYTVNNGTLSLQINGTTKTTFTANQSSSATFNVDLSEFADAMVYKGVLAGGSTSPGTFTPAADKGHTYKISTEGYINGIYMHAGDMVICNTDSTVAATSSNYTTIKANWDWVNRNEEGEVIGPSSVAATGNIAVFDGTSGKLVKDGGQTIEQILAAGPSSYIKEASTSGNTLTLTKKDGTTVSFVNSTYTIPTVGSAALTVKRNSTSIGSFNANATAAGSINVHVPITGASVSGNTLTISTATAAGGTGTVSFVNSTYTIPTVGSAALTIQANGTSLGSFGANATTASTINIPAASASSHGVVTTGDQTFAGNKTFNGTVTVGAHAVMTYNSTTESLDFSFV